MFKIEKINSKGFQEFVISDTKNKNRCSIVPDFGANIRELVLNNESIIDGYETLEQFKLNNKYKSSFLIPFPNRISTGTYSYKNKLYQLPRNDGQNALHGFFHNRKVKIKEQIIMGKSASLTFAYKYIGDYQGYPFNFNTEVKITLNAEGFQCLLEIISDEDEGMPVGIGWHPYFQIGNELVDTFQLKVPNCKLIKTDNNKIPGKKRIPFKLYAHPYLINDEHYDTGFVVSSNRCIVELYSLRKKKGIRIEQERNKDTNCYFQIYTPPDRKSIAIEPMTCAADCFNNNMGLEILKKSEKLNTLIKVSLF